MGIRCPKCDGPTAVSETREIEGGLRRRRACVDVVCDGRITTVELPAPKHAAAKKTKHGPLALIAASDLAMIRDIVNRPIGDEDNNLLGAVAELTGKSRGGA